MAWYINMFISERSKNTNLLHRLMWIFSGWRILHPHPLQEHEMLVTWIYIVSNISWYNKSYTKSKPVKPRRIITLSKGDIELFFPLRDGARVLTKFAGFFRSSFNIPRRLNWQEIRCQKFSIGTYLLRHNFILYHFVESWEKNALDKKAQEVAFCEMKHDLRVIYIIHGFITFSTFHHSKTMQ